jgi:hypothetical protein
VLRVVLGLGELELGGGNTVEEWPGVEHWLVVDVHVEDKPTAEVVGVGLRVVEQHLVKDRFDIEVVGVDVEDRCIVEVDGISGEGLSWNWMVVLSHGRYNI